VKDGVYHGLSWDDYRAIDAANWSTLKRFADSPAHARYAQFEGEEPSASMRLGTAAHCLLWEPERFRTDYAVGPEVHRGSKEWKAWAAENPNKQLVKPSEVDEYAGIVKAVRAHPEAHALIAGEGQNEVSIVWTDPETGTKCKSRLDRMTKHATWNIIPDLKTCQDAKGDWFARDVYNLGYHGQAAFYLWGVTLLTGLTYACAWIAAENKPYHGVEVHEPDDKVFADGTALYRKYLNQYAECQRTGVWPSYSPTIKTISRPPWAK